MPAHNSWGGLVWSPPNTAIEFCLNDDARRPMGEAVTTWLAWQPVHARVLPWRTTR